MNGTKSKFNSVQSAVEDMIERSGLSAFNKSRIANESETSRKTASVEPENNSKGNKNSPDLLKKHPQILSTIENVIKDSRGNLSIPAILGRIRSIHQNDVSDDKMWDDNKLIILISKLNLAAKTDNPNLYKNESNLGMSSSSPDDKIDPSNTDAFHSLNPAKI